MTKKHVGAAVSLLVFAVLAAGPAGAQQTSQATVKAPISGNKVPPPAILKPDFVIHKIWFAKWVDGNPNVVTLVPITTDLKLGEKVMMICDLENAGPADSKGLWLLGFYIDDAMMWNNSWGDLAAGKTLRGTGPYTPTALGIHNFRCVCDVNKQIAELHEDNNVKEILFKVVK